MTAEMMIQWLKEVWYRKPGALLLKRGMLAVDAFQGHVTGKVKSQASQLNKEPMVISGSMTSQLQVLDVVVN
jgi:hypothetical protein